MMTALETVEKGKAFFDKGLAVCSRKVLSTVGGQNSHSQPEKYFFREQGEIAEAPPVADAARRFQGSGAIGGAQCAGNRNAATWYGKNDFHFIRASGRELYEVF